jgi:hypothetical protein
MPLQALVKSGKKHNFEQSSPFAAAEGEQGEMASTAYRYRK